MTGFEGSKSEGNVPSSQLRMIFMPKMPIFSEGNIFRRSNRRSRNLFLGNIPDTACRMTCTPKSNQVIQPKTRWQRNGTYMVWVLRHHIFVRRLLQPSREHRMLSEEQLLLLLSSNFHPSRVRHNYVVPAVHCWKVRALSIALV